MAEPESVPEGDLGDGPGAGGDRVEEPQAGEGRIGDQGSASTPRRRSRWLENGLQWELICRAFLYAAAAALYAIVVGVSQGMFSTVDGRWQWWSPAMTDAVMYAMPGLALVGPIVIYDMVRMSHRYAGPVAALHREMQSLVRGESDSPMRLRSDDRWKGLESSFNAIREELIRRRKEAGER